MNSLRDLGVNLGEDIDRKINCYIQDILNEELKQKKLKKRLNDCVECCVWEITEKECKDLKRINDFLEEFGEIELYCRGQFEPLFEPFNLINIEERLGKLFWLGDHTFFEGFEVYICEDIMECSITIFMGS